jgi:hypothetical protein
VHGGSTNAVVRADYGNRKDSFSTIYGLHSDSTPHLQPLDYFLSRRLDNLQQGLR